jgi:hypothetical protein
MLLILPQPNYRHNCNNDSNPPNQNGGKTDDDDDSSKGNGGKIGENKLDGKIDNGPTYTTTMTPQSSSRENTSENLATPKDLPIFAA